MAEYIDREAFIAWIEKQKRLSKLLTIMMLQETPAADVVEVVHGRWRWGRNSMNQYGAWCTECECGWEDKGNDFDRVQGLVIAHKYCPNCGARMDGDKNGSDLP